MIHINIFFNIDTDIFYDIVFSNIEMTINWSDLG